MGNWSELPNDLIWKISNQLTAYEDFTAFRGVCKSWRSGVIKKEFKHDSPGNVPWLMLAPSKSKDNQVQQFYSLSKEMVHGVFLPETKDRKVYSSQGWLITIEKDWAMHLLHPFTRAQIQLPSLKTVHNWNWDFWATSVKEFNFVKKVALSRPPFAEDGREECIVMIIYGGQRMLSFCRPGDTRWTYINAGMGCCCDLTYHQRKFYVVNVAGTVVACVLNSGKKYDTYKIGTLPIIRNTWHIVGSTESSLFLVGSTADTMFFDEKNSLQEPLVGRHGQVYDMDGQEVLNMGGEMVEMPATLTKFYDVEEFVVFKMDMNSGKCRRVSDLGNKSIFVGTSSTILVSDNSDTIYPNSIYFTDDPVTNWLFTKEGGDTNMGIYCLEDESFISDLSAKYVSLHNPPMWIFPSY